MKLAATLSAFDAERTPWEAVVIGAGPAGAFLSLRLAQQGLRVLLLEKQEFPREKVCGGCVGPRAVDLLAAAGLQERLKGIPSIPTNRFRLHTARRSAEISLPQGLVIERSRLDAMLVEAAIAAGAEFLPRTSARVGCVEQNRRQVQCRPTEGPAFNTRAMTVVAADGLMHSSLSDVANTHSHVAPNARLGIGAVIEQLDSLSDSLGIHSGVIHMSVTPSGYVGLARVAPTKVIVAAATDATLLSRAKQPALAVAAVLSEAGRQKWAELAAGPWRAAAWHGTPPLTRRMDRPAAERLFVIGDAAGYIEPFTGEGITCALAAAAALTPLVVSARSHWDPRLHRAWLMFCQAISRRQRLCRGLAWLLRSPWLVEVVMSLLTVAPSCSIPFVRYWNRSLHFGREFSL